MFLLDGKEKRTDYTAEDQDRTKLIAHLLSEWGLVRLKTKIEDVPNSDVTIIPYKDKKNWSLRSKYTIGANKKSKPDENKGEINEKETTY